MLSVIFLNLSGGGRGVNVVFCVFFVLVQTKMVTHALGASNLCRRMMGGWLAKVVEWLDRWRRFKPTKSPNYISPPSSSRKKTMSQGMELGRLRPLFPRNPVRCGERDGPNKALTGKHTMETQVHMTLFGGNRPFEETWSHPPNWKGTREKLMEIPAWIVLRSGEVEILHRFHLESRRRRLQMGL